jgi:large subunit ribosomal protein L29
VEKKVKLADIKEKTTEELNEEVITLRKKLFDLRLQKSLHKLENTSEISKTKKLIAQVKTVIQEKTKEV